MNKFLIHLPHTSTKIPIDYICDWIIPSKQIFEEADIMMDHYVEGIVGDLECIKFPYSRIFCDVERFNDETEIMNDIGMGVLYTHSHNGELIRNVKYQGEILKYYEDHHSKLNLVCSEKLSKFGEVIVLDIHSYNKEALPYEKFKKLRRPDICIGYDEKHFSKSDLEKIIYIIESYGLSWGLNEPFKGCLVPSDYYHKDDRVRGYMLDFRKDKIGNVSKEILEKIIKEL